MTTQTDMTKLTAAVTDILTLPLTMGDLGPSSPKLGTEGVEAKVEPGSRYDAGKLRWDLVPPDVMEELVKVYTRGAAKYADRNWEKGMTWGRILRALKSHLNKWEKGEEFDEELTDCRHLAMVMWNAAALMAYQMRKVGTDDRPAIGNPA